MIHDLDPYRCEREANEVAEEILGSNNILIKKLNEHLLPGTIKGINLSPPSPFQRQPGNAEDWLLKENYCS
jgi:hypothetical protein